MRLSQGIRSGAVEWDEEVKQNCPMVKTVVATTTPAKTTSMSPATTRSAAWVRRGVAAKSCGYSTTPTELTRGTCMFSTTGPE